MSFLDKIRSVNLGSAKSISLNSGLGTPRSPSDRGRGRALWREVFGTTKEEGSQFPKVRNNVIPGGSWGKSALAEPAAFKRLLQAYRSMAPGGWSDDRWEQSRHLLGITFVAITRICRQLSRAEFQIFRKDRNHPDGKVPVMPDDPPEGDRPFSPYKLVELLEKPNWRDSFGKLMYRWGQQLRLTGKALTWMVPNQLGVPMELYCVPTAIAIPQPAINPDYPDGYYRIQPLYPYGPFSSYPTPATAVGAPIPAQWMLEFQYPHPLLFYDGYSPLTGVRQQVDQLESIDNSRWWTMKRTVNPSAVLNLSNMEDAQPWVEAELERVRAEFENSVQGLNNVGQLLVPPPGGSIEPWGAAAKDMEYQAGWEQIASFILGGGFGIPKPAAGMADAASYANFWASMKQLYWNELEPECEDIGASLTRHLAPFFGDDLIVEVRCKPINDHEITFGKINLAIAAQCITKNQVLKLLDLPVTKEKWGSEIAGTPPQQMMPGMEGGAGGGLGALLAGATQGAPNPEGSPMPAPQGPAGANGQPTRGEEERQAPRELAAPTPGPVSRGPLGPRKALDHKVLKKELARLPKGAELPQNSPKFGTKSLNGRHTKDLNSPAAAAYPPAGAKPLVVQPDVTINLPPMNVTVNVPEQPAPRVTVDSPVVNVTAPAVNFPEMRPVFNVAAPQVRVENAPPQVTVNVPEQPAPVVNLPKDAINVTVDQKPSVVNISPAEVRVENKIDPTPVNVNLPELQSFVSVTAPEIKLPDVQAVFNVPSPEIKVENHVPESKSIVNVTVPESKPPDVHVIVPEPRPRVKVISYDEYGRPVRTVEQELPSGDEGGTDA